MVDMAGGACCPVVTDIEGKSSLARAGEFTGDIAAYVEIDDQGIHTIRFLVDGIHCGGCIKTIEDGLNGLDGVVEARVNLSTSRLAVRWDRADVDPSSFISTLAALGYRAVPYSAAQLEQGRDVREKALLRAMAVAGFAAANVMLLSVAVWAGHFSDMGPHTRTFMHWVSALIAVPAVIYAGRPFFNSAIAVLKQGRTNMDVPISLAVLLATGMSLSETMRGAEHAYFDSAITLLFFLLIGRYLDTRARGKAQATAEQLISLNAVAVTVLKDDGTTAVLPPSAVTPGQKVLVAAGEKIGIDGMVVTGQSDVDTSVISGETVPQSVEPGSKVFAGMLNIGAPLTLVVNAVGESTLLAEICRLMENAEQRKARYVGLADKVARAYAPVVHTLAAITFAGWLLWGSIGWQGSLMVAVAVLIITCPCALGLAVPVVQVVASGRLLKMGILLKSGTALERLSDIDTVVFDKTGTLTVGKPVMAARESIMESDLVTAASAARHSKHPLAQALVEAADGLNLPDIGSIDEIPGCGLTWETNKGRHRLGSRRWIGEADDATAGPELWLQYPNGRVVCFKFTDTLREDAAAVVNWLQTKGIDVRLLSGDRQATVADVAGQVGIVTWEAEYSPSDKAAYLDSLREDGKRVLMVGDGINDAPALASAYVSMSPTTAADISQNAADIVFQGKRLGPLPECIRVAKQSDRLVKENFGLAFAYNIVTIPLAMAGFVTPLIASVAMSSSSLVVIGNALRLGLKSRH